MDNYVDLEEVDDFIPDETSRAKYPHVLIEGITTEEEVLYFHNKFHQKDKSLPLYIRFENLYRCIGSFELTLDNLIIVRSISNYKITLRLSPEKAVPVDLEQPDSYLKFLSIF